MTEERRNFLMSLPGFIILIKKPDSDKLWGPVENSWSLGVEENRTYFFWTGTAHSIVGSSEFDGREMAEKEANLWKEKYPDWEFSVYNVRDPELPIVLNWELWLDAHELSDDTFSGIKNKHEARNLRFHAREISSTDKIQAEPLKMRVTEITMRVEP